MINDPWKTKNQLRWNLFDGNQVVEGSIHEFDLVIVGSGAGGGVAAAELSNAGLKVALVEEGNLNTHKDFGKSEAKSYRTLYYDNGNRMTKDKSISILQGRGVGGSTVVNWTSSFHLPSDTLAYWQKHFGVNWGEEELAPHYAAMEARLNIEEWKLEPNQNNASLEKGLEKIGKVSKRIARNVKGCINLGYCGLGCPINAKQSMLTTTIPDALENGASLFYNSYALRFNWDKNAIESLECHHTEANGRYSRNSFTLRAKHFVLAAGAIGSPALLLRSRVPDPGERIGKNTTLHPSVVSGAVMNEGVYAFSGAPQSVYSDEYLKEFAIDGKLGFKLETIPIFPMTLAALLPNTGASHREFMRALPYVQGTIALIRDGFDPECSGGQVSISGDGLPIVDYKWTKELGDAARRAFLAMAELQFAAGAKQVYPLHAATSPYTSWADAKNAIASMAMDPPSLRIVSAHVMGGCAMGKGDEGVVDDQGRFRHLDNLTISDGSIFPTSLGANPQLSIYGMVRMISKNLVQQLA